MTAFLRFLGVLIIISGIIWLLLLIGNGGFGGGLWAFFGFFCITLFHMMCAAFCFALAEIIDNQERILWNVQNGQGQSGTKQKIDLSDKKVCPKCEREYDNDMYSCPYCGCRP